MLFMRLDYCRSGRCDIKHSTDAISAVNAASKRLHYYEILVCVSQPVSNRDSNRLLFYVGGVA